VLAVPSAEGGRAGVEVVPDDIEAAGERAARTGVDGDELLVVGVVVAVEGRRRQLVDMQLPVDVQHSQ
jgi:hypothetical protein